VSSGDVSRVECGVVDDQVGVIAAAGDHVHWALARWAPIPEHDSGVMRDHSAGGQDGRHGCGVLGHERADQVYAVV